MNDYVAEPTRSDAAAIAPRSDVLHAMTQIDIAQRRDTTEPEKGASSTRREPRKIRYSDAEWATIAARARECGKAPARYVREVSLGAVPRTKRSHSNAELIRELGRVANTLARLASAQSDGAAASEHAPIQHALAELLAVVRRID